jgi:NAD(P)-dependent dehydrogenase (short-subunit alcohol dehydrogenase family)
MEKTALVTGGNSGIGYATAKFLKKKNYRVFISGYSSERVIKAAKELDVEPIIADMGEIEDVKNMASGFQETGLDALVNNAAILSNKPVTEYQPEDYTKAFNVNVRGPVMLIKELIPALEKREGGVTNISSVVAIQGLSNSTLYSATKGGLEAATRSLAAELAPKSIRVNAVTPGAVNTPIYFKAGVEPDMLDTIKRFFKDKTPLKRFGTPEELAYVVVAQLESKFTTGAVWVVDGGFSSCMEF